MRGSSGDNHARISDLSSVAPMFTFHTESLNVLVWLKELVLYELCVLFRGFVVSLGGESDIFSPTVTV